MMQDQVSSRIAAAPSSNKAKFPRYVIPMCCCCSTSGIRNGCSSIRSCSSSSSWTGTVEDEATPEASLLDVEGADEEEEEGEEEAEGGGVAR